VVAGEKCIINLDEIYEETEIEVARKFIESITLRAKGIS
jgi:hypothetical protein